MEATMRDILISTDSLRRLMNAAAPPKLALRLARLARRIDEIQAEFNQAREMVLARYMKDGQIPEELLPQAQADMEQLLDQAVQIPDDLQIWEEDLESLDNIKLSAMDVVALSWLFRKNG